MARRAKGSGSIVEVKGRKKPWRAVFTDDFGKTQTQSFRTKKEASAFLDQIKTKKQTGTQILKNGILFSAFLELYLQEKQKQNMKPSSYAALEQNMRRAEQDLGQMPLDKINNDVLQALINQYAKAGYSQSILKKTEDQIIAMLRMAASKGYLPYLPVFDIVIPNIPSKRPSKLNYFSEEERRMYEDECRRTYVPAKYTKHAGEELLYHVSGYKLLLILHTGLRLGEALALTWADFSDESKTLTVNKNVVYVKQDGEFKKITQDSTKTTAGERVLVLNKSAYQDLLALRQQHEEQTETLQRRKDEALREAKRQFSGEALKAKNREIEEQYKRYFAEHKYICGSASFPFGSGSASGIQQTHRRILKHLPFDHNVSVHGLRHTYVTHYYIHHCNDPDFDLPTFSRMIGHASIRTTMEIYAHLEMVLNNSIPRTEADLKEF